MDPLQYTERMIAIQPLYTTKLNSWSTTGNFSPQSLLAVTILMSKNLER